MLPSFLVFGSVVLVLLYLGAVRPQRQFLRAQQRLVASLEVGDRVISSAGIFGTITGLTDDVVTLEVAPGVEIRVARPAIARRVELGTPSDDPRHLAEGASTDDHPVPTTDAVADGPVSLDQPALREE